MAILVNVHQISKSFGVRPLFEGLSFSIESQDRIGLIGPNGAGKSTLLKILAGIEKPDAGQCSVQRGLRVSYLSQVPTFQENATVLSTLLEGAEDPDDWEAMSMAHEWISRLSAGEKIEEEQPVKSLSGGWKKKLALAREILRKPDLLLLDEPTNHLDVPSIQWLEDYLAQANFATLTITHDRQFLQQVSNRILELDRKNPGGILSVKGDYVKYLELKESLMSAQAQAETKLKNTLRRETEWLKRGAKARTTKQQARIQRHGELSQEVEELEYRNQNKEVRFDFQGTEKAPKKLIEAKGITKGFGDKVVVPKFDLVVGPKSRIGLLGKNGSGKTTLLKMLVGEEKPDQGEVFFSEHLKIVWFEQNRESLDPDATVVETLCPRGDSVIFRGAKVHIKGYLDRFLFTPTQMEMKVGKLSGGEQSRLLVAKLMLQEANVLVLDEPTNDLDIATLDVLEEVLRDFSGAVLLVSHDRYFLDQVAKEIYAFEGPKILTFHGVQQWESWKLSNPSSSLGTQDKKRSSQATSSTGGSGTFGSSSKGGASGTEGVAGAAGDTDAAGLAGAAGNIVGSGLGADSKASNTSGAPKTAKKKLSYKEQFELDQMEEKIQKAEEALTRAVEESNKPEYASQASKLMAITEEMRRCQEEVDRLYARWEELEQKREPSQ